MQLPQRQGNTAWKLFNQTLYLHFLGVTVLIIVILQEQCALTDKPISHFRTLVSNVCTELIEFPGGSWTIDSSDLLFSHLTEFNARTWLCALMPFEIKIR
jgi:hypothetical protein